MDSKFKTSCKFVMVKPNAKCEAAIGCSESVKVVFTHLDFPSTFSQCTILFKFMTPIDLNNLTFIRAFLASFRPLQLTKITFVSFANDELNNKLFNIKRCL